MSHKSDYIKKLKLKCKCGRPAIDFDSRFTSYTPCDVHSKESPVEYSNRVYTGVSTEIEDAMIMSKYEEHFKDQESKQWYQRFVENTQLLWILNKREMPIEIKG
jgi:hypothetical protein